MLPFLSTGGPSRGGALVPASAQFNSKAKIMKHTGFLEIRSRISFMRSITIYSGGRSSRSEISTHLNRTMQCAFAGTCVKCQPNFYRCEKRDLMLELKHQLGAQLTTLLATG